MGRSLVLLCAAVAATPSQVGVRVDAGTRLGRINADGLRREGQAFLNDAYGASDGTLKVEVQGGAGQIYLEVVQELGKQEATRQQGSDTTTLEQGGETTMTQGGETTTLEQDADVGLPAILVNPQRYYGQKSWPPRCGRRRAK